MATQYKNFKEFLEAGDKYELLTSESDFIERKKEDKNNTKFNFRCKTCDKVNELTCASFINKKCRVEYEQFCSGCFNKKTGADVKESKLEIAKAEIEALNGHKIISYKNNKEIEYECGNCGEINKSTLENLRRSTGVCSNCQNDKNKISFIELKLRVETLGFKLLLKAGDYKNNKQKLPLICICGNETYSAVLRDIEAGKSCSASCKQRKYKETCTEKYGVTNYFAASEFQDKRKETCIEKYGVEHHMQSEEIKRKAEETCLQFYGAKWAFTQDYVFEKIRATHKEKYGVEYPLQSREIQEKIENRFIELWNAKRPFLSEKFIEHFKGLMKEKYGSEWYVTSEHFKQQIVDKYGSEYYVNSEHSKEKMKEKYGSEYFINSEFLKREMLEKYGSEYYVNSEHSKEKMKEKYGSEYFINSEFLKREMLEKYGVENAMQCPELFHKATRTMYSSKPYTFPSGKQVQVMGYENVTLDTLQTKKNSVLKRSIKEDEILVGNEAPHFKYEDDNGKKRIYYPDIAIKNTELIIEVKSVYIFNTNPKMNYSKFKAVANTGKVLQVYIYNRKKKLIDIWIFHNSGFITSKAGRTVFDKCIELKGSEKDFEIDEDIQNEFCYEQLIDELERLFEE